jgi:hypothetical protein
MLDIRGDRDIRAGAGAPPFAPEEELDVAFEDEERVRVVGMGVRVDALEVGREEELDRLDISELPEDAVIPDPLAFAGGKEDRLVHCGGS